MRPSYFLVCALLSHAAIGCSDSIPTPPPPGNPEPVTVHLNSGLAPKLIAFRDGFPDGLGKGPGGVPLTWQSVTPGTAVTFIVHGPYSVTAVCQNPTDGSILMWQVSHIPDDDTSDTVMEPTLSTPCAADPLLHKVSGTLAQPGTVHLGDQEPVLGPATGQFSFMVPDGTYFLTATADGSTKIALQRIPVHGADVSAPVDVAATGVASVQISLEVDNPPNPDTSTEMVTASVAVTPKSGAASSLIFSGNLDLANKQKVEKAPSLPDSALMSGDTQSATMAGDNSRAGATTDTSPRATTIMTHRQVTRPFKMGDDITKGMIGNGLSLPTGIRTPAVAFDTTNRLGLALPSLPALDDLTMKTSGVSASNGTTKVAYQLNITTTFFTATLLAHPVFDTDIPGFMPAWKIDFNKEYKIDIVSQRSVTKAFVGHETSEFHETVTTMPPPMN